MPELESEPEPEQVAGFIYFIRAKMERGPIKIGRTGDPERRLACLRTMSPVPLEPLGIVSEELFDEMELHIEFREFRLHGEWFEPHPSLMDFIAEYGDPWPVKPPREPPPPRPPRTKYKHWVGPLRIVNGVAKRERRVLAFIERDGQWVPM